MPQGAKMAEKRGNQTRIQRHSHRQFYRSTVRELDQSSGMGDVAKPARHNEEAAKGLMRDQPALIKRPVFETKTGIIVGFKQTEVEAIKASI
jgi:arsenate reductase-like glutaredoxin family protein